MITVEDYPNFEEKLNRLDVTLSNSLTFLPANLSSAETKDDLIMAESTQTVKVVLRQAGIPFSETSGEIMLQFLESFDWFGPTIFIASTLITQNPQVVDRLIDVISDYLKAFFKGVPESKKNAKLHIVNQTKKGTYKKIDYDGPVEGLKELPRIIRSQNDES